MSKSLIARCAGGTSALVVLLAVSTLGLAPAYAASGNQRGAGSPQDTIPHDFAASSVSALSPTDVWAVGNPWVYSPDEQGIVEHWDGDSWSRIALPAMKTSTLSSVQAITPTDVWALGETGPAHDRQLILHWTGAAWTRVSSPNARGREFLEVLSSDSPTDVWAAGEVAYLGPDRSRLLVERWDGESWSIVPTPTIHGRFVGANSITALSPTDVWMSGREVTDHHGAVALIEHWNGTTWTRVRSAGGRDVVELSGITAVTAADVWAVGDADGATFIEHWDGDAWSAVPSPAPGLQSSLSAVSAASSTDVWAVGNLMTESHPIIYEPLIVHWDGSVWSQVAVEGEAGNRDYLSIVSADTADDAWAFGFSGARDIVRHWDGTRWS